MNKYFYRHHYPAAVSLLVASLFSMGSIHPGNAESSGNPVLRQHTVNEKNPGQNRQSATIGFPVKTFTAAFVDKDNVKWFITDQGIVSFNGEKWVLHNTNRKVPSQDLKGFAYEANQHGHEMWIGSPKGATVASLPVDARTGATTYHTENTTILSNNVVRVAIGKSPMRWFGTDKGISAFQNDKWLTPAYEEMYPQAMFQDFPITSMATNSGGDSLYVGTDGGGVARVYRDDVDGISGASSYAQWGPILLPSDKIYSIFVDAKNTQWFGTDLGVARHTGPNTMENWTVFTTSDGIPDNFVQAISGDKEGNIWIGTRKGASEFDGSVWFTISKEEGLNSNNVLCITVDANGTLWFGTDDGVTSYQNGTFTNYR
jgi:ligand-binding sensor domain-containing protein